MDAIYVIFFIIIIVLLITNNNKLNSRIGELELKIIDLKNMIRGLNVPKPTVENQKTVIEPEVDYVVKPVSEKAPDIPLPPPPKAKEPEIERHIEVINDPFSNIRKTPKPEPVIEEPRLSFFERYPDLEKFIGENLINKIGIAILVLAIGFFVKYAIDNNWVGPAGRVGIGILCGGILIAIAHRLRNSYKAFSSVLVGGGLAIFYFTITLAYHEFHLFDQTVSFIILIVITCFAVALSMLYDKQELAVIALVGGMSSPFMVSNGSANYNALFIYLITLNAGLLVIAYFKSWRVLNITAFGLTVLVLAGIVYTLPVGAYQISFTYITVLYLMFFLINIAYNIRENKKFITSDFSILLINTALYFSTGLYLLTMMHDEQFRGLFSASIGALNLLFSFVLFRTKRAEINILYLLIGITLTFISLAAPIQLHGHFITLFWAAESVLLYWLYQKSSIKLIRLVSLLIWIAMLLSLMMDWSQLYISQDVRFAIIANKGFITTVFSAICTWVLYAFASKSHENGPLISPAIYNYVAIILLFCSGALEINHQFLNRYPATDLNILYLMLYLPAFVYVFCLITDRFFTTKMSRGVIVGIYAATITVYLLLTPEFFSLQSSMFIAHTADTSHFVAHWIGAIFILLIFYALIKVCRVCFQAYIKPISWILSAGIVLFLSLEICLLSNLLFYTKGTTMDHIETVYIKTALPVIWGVLSFALMWLGMRYKIRVLRIISLTLFTITLVKLFVFDIENIPAAGKIAAFFCLGVLLLIISFMYQKVKVIIADDGEPKS
ncbi:Predicted membrane protein [Mucilaginibacter mallensis]|uniref:Predicted membrane protein n=1 Tax=Mucilaginibacter mallensis TaxID=652787 RepID=A0A1H1V9F9_MUCMA|nr:DUF2339 domain-containing protein [Mucilaginibacter mallensis]SDS81026.1 Predicted membrane protein [Mucilaginibacter mallensis]